MFKPLLRAWSMKKIKLLPDFYMQETAGYTCLKLCQTTISCHLSPNGYEPEPKSLSNQEGFPGLKGRHFFKDALLGGKLITNKSQFITDQSCFLYTLYLSQRKRKRRCLVAD